MGGLWKRNDGTAEQWLNTGCPTTDAAWMKAGDGSVGDTLFTSATASEVTPAWQHRGFAPVRPFLQQS